MNHTLELTPEMKDALSRQAVDYIKNWWEKTATPEEKQSAIERKATPKGAYKFVEDVVKKYAKRSGNCACLPDALTYDLAGIFLRIGSDGDKFLTKEEMAKVEKEEAEKAKRKAEAEKAEAERKAALTPELRAEEERIEAERKAKEEAEAKKREEANKARLEAIKARERQKALAEEVAKRQMTFEF